MLKPIDIFVLVGLLVIPGSTFSYLQSNFSAILHIPPSSLTRSLQRLTAVGLLAGQSRTLKREAATELLIHGVPYLLPSELGPRGRGVPTAHSAPPLSALITSEEPLVWPDDEGAMTGTTLKPLHPSVPRAAREVPDLHVALALIDALRVGRARERKLAVEALRKHLSEMARLDHPR